MKITQIRSFAFGRKRNGEVSLEAVARFPGGSQGHDFSLAWRKVQTRPLRGGTVPTVPSGARALTPIPKLSGFNRVHHIAHW